MSSKKSKKTIIEGWLKKKKSESSLKFFSGFTKRWFALDIVNAIFTYATGKGKNCNKVIPLRDIVDLEANNDYGKREPKEWEYDFKVITKDRSYHLFAPNKAEKEMWVHAFNTILKYKRKASENKPHEKHHDEDVIETDQAAEDDDNDDGGFEEEKRKRRGESSSSEDSREYKRKKKNPNEGDYMEDNGRRQLKGHQELSREEERRKEIIENDEEYKEEKHTKK